MSTLALTAKSLVALAIITLLVVFDPWVALFVTVVLGGAYGAIYRTRDTCSDASARSA